MTNDEIKSYCPNVSDSGSRVVLLPKLREICLLALSARSPAERTGESYFKDWLEQRGVDAPCIACDGFGVRMYGSTATWRGGVGGQTMTQDVCDKCWGSGDANRIWPSHRKSEPQRSAE